MVELFMKMVIATRDIGIWVSHVEMESFTVGMERF